MWWRDFQALVYLSINVFSVWTGPSFCNFGKWFCWNFSVSLEWNYSSVPWFLNLVFSKCFKCLENPVPTLLIIFVFVGKFSLLLHLLFKFKYAVYSWSILLMRFSRCLAFLLDLQCFPFPVFSFVFPLVFLSLYWILLHILNLNFLFHLAVCVLLEFVFSNFFEYTYNYPSCSWASFFIY